jgi:hypothetical protein
MKIRNYLEISVGMTNKGGDEVDLAKITELRRVKLDREKIVFIKIKMTAPSSSYPCMPGETFYFKKNPQPILRSIRRFYRSCH